MSGPNEEAAVNAMAAQVVYGDDELKRDMEWFIVEAVIKNLTDVNPMLALTIANAVQKEVGRFIIVNQAREIEKIVARYLTSKIAGDQY